jgi:hypothetical protein
MLFKKIVHAYDKNHKQHINTYCRVDIDCESTWYGISTTGLSKIKSRIRDGDRNKIRKVTET